MLTERCIWIQYQHVRMFMPSNWSNWRTFDVHCGLSYLLVSFSLIQYKSGSLSLCRVLSLCVIHFFFAQNIRFKCDVCFFLFFECLFATKYLCCARIICKKKNEFISVSLSNSGNRKYKFSLILYTIDCLTIWCPDFCTVEQHWSLKIKF